MCNSPFGPNLEASLVTGTLRATTSLAKRASLRTRTFVVRLVEGWTVAAVAA
jgi:hypothetical protein